MRPTKQPATGTRATPEHLTMIRDAMFGGGQFGRHRRRGADEVPGVCSAGKTGTAQVRRITMAERASGVLKNASLPFKLRDHALFVCFAPATIRAMPRASCSSITATRSATSTRR
jgi:penicillin-binding protein 2